MKKILLSLVVVVAVAAIAGGATWSYFSDTATSSSNTFSAGTMDLRLTDDDQTALNNVNSSFEGSNLYPGAVIPEQTLIVRNNGTIDGDHLDLTVTLNPVDADLADYIYLTDANFGTRFGGGSGGGVSVNMLAVLLGGSDTDYMLYDGDTGGALGSIDTSGDGEISLQELADAGRIRISPLAEDEGIAAGTEATLWFNAEVGTDLTTQGETVNATYTFELHQDSSQY